MIGRVTGWTDAGQGEKGAMMHARSRSFGWSPSLSVSVSRASARTRTPGKIAESRTRIKNHRPCPVASLLVPRCGAPVLPNRIHHNWHEKRTSERAERTETDQRDGTVCRIASEESRGITRGGLKERGNFGDRRDQRRGAEIDGNTDT